MRRVLQPVLSQKDVDVTIEGTRPAMVNGERFLVRQALSNLIQNAVDFSDAGGAIEISAVKDDGNVTIRVRDHGPGIPEYALDKVFDRFYSLRRPDTGKKSSGLGLAFVREAAVLHGGNVTLTNHDSGGVEAVLTLPVEPARRTY